MKTTYFISNEGAGKSSTISAIRFIAMLFIITCHIMQYYDNPLCRWFNVGVQIFFLISGYLYGLKNIDEPIGFLKKQFKKILPPYYYFLAISIIIYLLFHPDFLSIESVIKSFFCIGTIKGLGHLWFVGYILFCYFLTPYLCGIRNHYKEKPLHKKLVVYLLLLVFSQIVGFLLPSYFMPDRVACYIIGFYLVDIYNSINKKKELILDSIIIIMGMFTNLIRGYIEYHGLNLPESALNGFVRYAHLFLGISLFLIFKYAFANIIKNRMLDWSDKYSYHFYIVHLLFILSPFTLMELTPIPFFNWVIVIIVSILSSKALSKLTNKQ